MAYHYLNVMDDDNINMLKDKFNIHPKVIYYIGYKQVTHKSLFLL